MTDNSQVKRVRALHTFKGTNNDELCFNKGDTVTVTQCIEGGWWEGTLNGKTGWFPSNYVKEIKEESPGGPKSPGRPTELAVLKRKSMQKYHNVVLQSVIETEGTHVNEMKTLLQKYIRPIKASGVLDPSEFNQLVGNLEDIVTFQGSFLMSLKECHGSPHHQRRVGEVFMRHAPRLKELYEEYCANHPRAVAVLQRKCEELNSAMENLGAPAPGSMTLTTSLSRPLTRLEKYPSLLKELERHIEESHIDRGDTQRAITIYRQIANSCVEIRKLKEMEYEIINSPIINWEGEEISTLGEVVHISKVKVLTQMGEKFERILVLFPNLLVMLSISPRLSGYHYEGKIPLSGMTVSACEDTEAFPHSLEISGDQVDKMTVTCGTQKEATDWLEILKESITRLHTMLSPKPENLQITSCQPSISQVMPAPSQTAKVIGQVPPPPSSHPPPPTHQTPHTHTSHPTLSPHPAPHNTHISHTLPASFHHKIFNTWSMSCLRPAPPLRPTVNRDDLHRKNCNMRRKMDDPRTFEEDAAILGVIEAYCNSAKTRHTVGSLDLTKLRLNDSADSDGGSLTDPLISPDQEDYALVRGQVMRGFCCASFPLAKGLARTIKRL
ncbi:rho guanine nucleotide exchange factor 7-like isoform X3 [Liolophura sinensis]|uniref:rho guanine nucleotide exchange factor 7-like isoform X3 n=1 Tax=Liolophura sinensis TaxID=3198878 RepID=UPI003158C714